MKPSSYSMRTQTQKRSLSVGSGNDLGLAVSPQKKQKVMTSYQGGLIAAQQCLAPVPHVLFGTYRQSSIPLTADGTAAYHPLVIDALSNLQQRLEANPVALVMHALDILARTQSDAPVRVCCIKTLRATVNSLGHFAFLRCEIITAVVASMERHIGALSVQLECGKLLQHLIKTSEDESCYSKRALSVAFFSMQNHPDNETLQCFCLDIVRRLKNPNSAQKDWVDGTAAIMLALSRHPAVPYIQQIGLSLLAWLAEDPVCREVVVEKNGIELIPMVMAVHHRDALIQCNAAAALCWLVHAGGRSGRCHLNTTHLPTIIKVLELHTSHQSAFGNLVCLLCGLSIARFEGNVLQLVRGGMKEHLASAKVQEGCLRWIRFRDLERYGDEILDYIPIIMEAMRAHPFDSHLQAQAAEVLATMAVFGHLRSSLMEKGAVELIFFQTLRLHRTDRRVQQAAVWFLTLVMQSTPANATTAFGGGLGTMEIIWRSLGIDHEGTAE